MEASLAKGVAVIQFLISNWLWIVFAIVMVAMHRQGGCGGHHHGRGHGRGPGQGHQQHEGQSDRSLRTGGPSDDTGTGP